jgi:hypothetical protein
MSDRGWCETCGSGNHQHHDWCGTEQRGDERADRLQQELDAAVERIARLERAVSALAASELQRMGWIWRHGRWGIHGTKTEITPGEAALMFAADLKIE